MPEPPTPIRPSRAGPEPQPDGVRNAAIAALLHRLNGGLNNASLAFELALSRNGNGDAESVHMLGRGLAGVEQASRAATLLALMVDPTAAPPKSAAGPFAQDVLDILRAHARRIGLSVDSEFDMPSVAALSATDITPTATAEALLAGLATLDRRARVSEGKAK